MSAATNPAGLKRICTSCGSRFYDLNKRPIICPNCNTEFTGEVKSKSRRSRITPEAKKESPIKEQAVNENEEDILEDEDDLEVVSLEDVDELDDEEDDEDAAIKLDEDGDLDDLADFDDDLDDDLEEDEDLLDDDED